MYNPSLRQEPRYEPAAVIPLKQESSILEWLKNNNRLIARDREESDLTLIDDDIELSELMDVEDVGYDDDGDDEIEIEED